MLKVGIIGASGYAGNELLRLVAAHPRAQLEYLASRSLAGEKVADQHVAFTGWSDLRYEPLEPAAMAERCDIVFAAVPHGAAMDVAPVIVAAGGKFVDLGTDFRFRKTETYEEWYKVIHSQPELSAKAAYGLPELFRETIKGAQVVGNPGCYPTGALLALAPLMVGNMVDQNNIVVTSMSGVSGAGATPKPMYHFPHCNENVQAYGTASHRHTPEIEQGLSLLSGGTDVKIVFTPHLIPMSRGIMTTAICAAKTAGSTEQLTAAYLEFYKDEPFVQVLSSPNLPQTKAVWGSNYCHIAVRFDARTNRIIVQSVIDNLVKGAAGQAVQNMNLLFGFPETEGLQAPGLLP